jgi:hypothetical protein
MSHSRPLHAETTSDEEDFWDDTARRVRKQMRARRAAASQASTRKKRKVEEKPRSFRYDHIYGVGDPRRKELDPEKSPWWDLIRHPDVRDPASAVYAKFRRKFRLPMPLVDKLLKRAQTNPAWKDKPPGPGHGRGHARKPLILKLLSVLRHLAKGHDPDTLEDAASISASTIKKFIPEFLSWFQDTFYAELVRLPEGDELRASLSTYARLGVPGAYCEADGTHLAWDSCPAAHHARYTGKEGYPTIAFNVSVLHNRRVIYVAPWCAGGVNDQTQARHDELFTKMRDGEIHPEIEYALFDEHGVAKKHKGLYIIVDNGYFQWRCLMAPLKHSLSDSGALWSERMESVRKSSETTFGILKKRFRLLRLPILKQNPHEIEHTFRTCCALHNMLLAYDEHDTVGRRAGDWLPAKDVAGRIRTERERAKHTVRAPHNTSGVMGEREPGFAQLREDLITHYKFVVATGRVGWLGHARTLRPAPHLRDDADEHDTHEDMLTSDLIYMENSDDTSEDEDA